MIKKIFLIILTTMFFGIVSKVQAQYCTPDNRFTEVPVFTDAQIVSTSSVVYGQAINYAGQNQTLIFNIHYPDPAVDTFSKRPLVILVHGGSFYGGNLNNLDVECKEFAKRGYAAATIEYRLGWNTGNTGCGGDPNSIQLAQYRGMQDVHAAMRYIVANAATYKIDTAMIFAGGKSAGCFVNVNLAFCNQQEMNLANPLLQQTLGNIDASSNSLTNTFRFKGLFHNWGSIVNINFIQPADAIPMIAFAGEFDSISHIDSGYFNNCVNFPKMWGSRAIYNKLVSYGQCASLTVKLNGGHGVWADTPAQDVFRIERACCFFKSLFCNNCTTQYRTDSIPANCSATTSISENKFATKDIKLFPNPFSSNINLETKLNETLEFKLTNSLGSLIWRGSNIDQQDFSALTEGIYFITINSQSTCNTIKLIKQLDN